MTKGQIASMYPGIFLWFNPNMGLFVQRIRWIEDGDDYLVNGLLMSAGQPSEIQTLSGGFLCSRQPLIVIPEDP